MKTIHYGRIFSAVFIILRCSFLHSIHYFQIFDAPYFSLFSTFASERIINALTCAVRMQHTPTRTHHALHLKKVDRNIRSTKKASRIIWVFTFLSYNAESSNSTGIEYETLRSYNAKLQFYLNARSSPL